MVIECAFVLLAGWIVLRITRERRDAHRRDAARRRATWSVADQVARELAGMSREERASWEPVVNSLRAF